MFGVDSGELFLIVLVAVVVIGPKDLPRVMRTVGHWVGRARGMANQFRSGVDQMMRESEIADLETKWREQNEAIMKAHPMTPSSSQTDAPAASPGTMNWGMMGPQDAPVMKPIGRVGPIPPVAEMPAKPTPAKLDKLPTIAMGREVPRVFPAAPDAAPAPTARRRPPRTAPDSRP